MISFTSTSAGCSMAYAIARAIASGLSATWRNCFMANSTNARTSKVGHVECAILRRTSSRVNFRGQLSQPVGAACAEHNGVSVGGEMTGGGFSDAAARAGDEDYLGFNVCFH